MTYNELRTRGTADFPIEYYYIDKTHARYDMSSHWHSEIEIIRVLEGSLRVKLNNNTYHAKKGDIVFVNPETVHGAAPENCIYECIVFHLDFLYTDTYSCRFFFESLLSREYAVNEFNPCASGEFHLAANELFEAMEHKSSGHKFRVIAALYKLFGVITDSHMYSHVNGSHETNENKNVPRLKKVLSFMRNNYDKPICLEDMADIAEMSLKYFCKFFKTMTGKTPFSYLNGYRVEKAAQKLVSTDLSVTEIAYSCGFNDLSYFIKTFKQSKGVSPGKYRQK